MQPWFWSVVFCALVAISLLLEILTPSMGLLTVLALLFSCASVWLGFAYTAGMGYAMIAVNLALFPLTIWIGMHFLQWSPFVHRAEVTAESQNAPDAKPLTYLLGKEGVTITPLRPGGMAMIGTERVNVVTQSKFVDPNTPIKVIQVEGARVVVEPV